MGAKSKKKRSKRKLVERISLKAPKTLHRNDSRRKDGGQLRQSTIKRKAKEAKHMIKLQRVEPITSAMFFEYNTKLGPPYHVMIDTNFIGLSIKNKLDIHQGIMDCLYAKCTCYITDCVMGELEKLGARYVLSLKMAKDPRFVRLACTHKGTYADDCLLERCEQHRCYILASCDKQVRVRSRKIPGVPILYISKGRYKIERMPDAFGAPK